MNLTKTSIVAVALLFFLAVGCHSTKVGRSAAVADSLAIAVKTEERMDSIIREVRIRDAKREIDLQRKEALKNNPRNIIDSIKCGLDSKKVFSKNFGDSVWVTYKIVEPSSEVVKSVFPNVVFFRECIEETMPPGCSVVAYYDMHTFYVDEFNELSGAVGSKTIDFRKRIEVFICWMEKFRSPFLRVEAISPFLDTTSYNARYNYKVDVSGGRYRYYFFQYENGVFLNRTANNTGVVE